MAKTIADMVLITHSKDKEGDSIFKRWSDRIVIKKSIIMLPEKPLIIPGINIDSTKRIAGDPYDKVSAPKMATALLIGGPYELKGEIFYPASYCYVDFS